MARVKTFRVNPEFGVPDRDIREFLNLCEKEAIINVEMCYIPAIGTSDPRLTVIVTKLDEASDIHINSEIDEERLASMRSGPDLS